VPKEIAMNRIRRLRRLAGVLAGLACAWLGLAAAAPTAFAAGYPTPGAGGPGGMAPPPLLPIRAKHPPLPPGHVTGPALRYNRAGSPLVSHVHTVVVGGMPGWQIALIAVGAALAAATIAVLADRVWAARRKPATAAA
jgi:hypothetical protein